MRLARRPTKNREAYQLLLKAQYHANKWTSEGLSQGIAYAKQAIEADPGYAAAYAWIAFTYVNLTTWGSLPGTEAGAKARAAALRALEIDESLAEAHTALGAAKGFCEWDWSSAERSFKRGIELNPNYVWAHYYYGLFLIAMERQQEAVAEMRLCSELDPLSVNLTGGLGFVFFVARDYDSAVEQFQKVLELDPSFFAGHGALARAYSEKGMHEEAIRECDQAVRLGTPLIKVTLGAVLANAGQLDKAREVLEELKRLPKPDYPSLAYLADLHGALGEKEAAFDLLEKAYKQHNIFLAYLSSPTFDSLREDPRFADLCRRIGLPQTAGTG